MVRKRVMGRNIVVVTDLEVIRDVLRDKEHFAHRAPTGISAIVPLGLLALETNDMWAHHRRLISPMFADRYMRVYGETFARLSEMLVDRWTQVARSGKSNDVHRDMMQLSLDALGNVVRCARCTAGQGSRMRDPKSGVGGLGRTSARFGSRGQGMCGFGTDFHAMSDPKNRYISAGHAVLQAALLQTAFVPTLFRLLFPGIARKSDAGAPRQTLSALALLLEPVLTHLRETRRANSAYPVIRQAAVYGRDRSRAQ